MASEKRFATMLRHRYDLTPDDVTPGDTPGHWYVREPCPGGDDCRHAFRGELGPCDGGQRLTVYYRDEHRDLDGRWLSPHRTWRRHRAATPESEAGENPNEESDE